MLKYIWMVIQDLFLTVTFATLIHTVLRKNAGKAGLAWSRTGIVAGTVAAGVLAFAKGTTNKIVSSRWNHKIYIFIIVFTLLFFVAALVKLLRGKKPAPVLDQIGGFSGAGVTAAWIFYSLPGVLLYPFNFNTMGNGYLSWYYMQRLVGWALALLILLIYAILLERCAFLIKKERLPAAVLLIGTMANGFYCLCRFFVPWVQRAKWLHWPIKYSKTDHAWARKLMNFSSRHTMDFLWIVAILVLVLLLAFFLENTKVTQPYDNPAQHRKLRAINRRHRRQAGGLLAFLGALVLSLTVVKAYDTREIALSPPETYTVEGERVLVPMEGVSDGHLHRFEYHTENDVDVRWIVVKKPGSASFGVGLDACEVCGNAGYYERNGQVVCKRCDVVMNINTIGFKGGCNPIPLSYEVEDGNLVFALEDLIAGEREFR